MALQPNGDVVIGGGFKALNGVPRNGLARLFADVNAHSGLAFAVNQVQVGEDGQAVSVTVNRLGNSQAPLTVDYLTSSGIAKTGVDFQGEAGTLQFAPGETQKTVVVLVFDDRIVSSDTQFTVTLSNPSSGALLGGGPITETVTVHDSDRPGSVDFGFNPALPNYPNPQSLNEPGTIETLALQPDGKLLVSGTVVITNAATGATTTAFRLNPDGSLDNTFGLTVPIWHCFCALPFRYFGPSILAFLPQADGRILVGGRTANIGDQTLFLNGTPISSCVARLEPDGSVDQSFNTGPMPGAAASFELQPDGKILVGGGFPAAGWKPSRLGWIGLKAHSPRS